MSNNIKVEDKNINIKVKVGANVTHSLRGRSKPTNYKTSLKVALS